MIYVLLFCWFLQDKPADPLPEGDGKKEVVKVCLDCHGPENIVIKKRTKQEWDDVVSQMVTLGANGTDQELDKIAAYLTKNFSHE